MVAGAIESFGDRPVARNPFPVDVIVARSEIVVSHFYSELGVQRSDFGGNSSKVSVCDVFDRGRKPKNDCPSC